jgi:hypothetical protein
MLYTGFRTVTAAALIVAVAVLSIEGAAVAQPRREPAHRVEFTSRRTDQVGTPVCDTEQHCLFPYSAVPVEWTGDFAGTGLLSGSSALGGTRGGFGWELNIFVGTIEPCGSGSVVISASGINTPDNRGSGRWTIVPGFGAGDLKGVTGSGTSTHKPGDDALSPITSGEGKVRC